MKKHDRKLEVREYAPVCHGSGKAVEFFDGARSRRRGSESLWQQIANATTMFPIPRHDAPRNSLPKRPADDADCEGDQEANDAANPPRGPSRRRSVSQSFRQGRHPAAM